MSELVHRNGILRKLPDEDVRALLPAMRRERVKVGQVIEAQNAPVKQVFFLESGVASVMALGRRGKKMETGPFGREGMSGLAVIHDVGHCPTETVIQIEGEAVAVAAERVSMLALTSPRARSVFLRYSYAFGLQNIQTALSAGLASVERRLARWLLMLHDRVDGDQITATHDFMAMMLGVRRPGVTVAIHVLEGHHLVKSTRGQLVVSDRKGLEEFCGEIYGLPEREYRRVLGEWPASNPAA